MFDCVTLCLVALGHPALMRRWCDSMINCVAFGGAKQTKQMDMWGVVGSGGEVTVSSAVWKEATGIMINETAETFRWCPGKKKNAV